MLDNLKDKKIYLACGSTDLRKSINGLTMIIQFDFELDPFDKALFIFCNRSKNLIKILEWDQDGFWLHMKRLDNGTFKWPSKDESESTMSLSHEDLTYFLGATKIEQKINKKESNKILF